MLVHDIARGAAPTPSRRALLPTGIALLLSAFCLLFGIAVAGPALAQGGDLRNGGLNPFPKDDIYRMHFVGDWLMDGLDNTLKEALKSFPRVQVQSRKIDLQSLRRSSWNQPLDDIKEQSKSAPIDMAVVMFGISEIGSLYQGGQSRHRFGTEGWLKQYAQRVDGIMKALRADNGAVYWIGLPVVRRRDHSEGYQVINSVIRERAYANGITFIDSYSRFQDENGGFNRYGPDLDGTIKLMRTKDGIYFTGTGYAKIAHFVMQMIRRDLKRVKSERVVTLAGSINEQRTIVHNKPSTRARRAEPASARKSARSGTALSPSASSRFGGQKADNGKFIFETVLNNKTTKIALNLPRPALSGAIMALVTRNQSKDKPANFGDNAVQVIEGGVPLLSTVTPAEQSAIALRKRRLSPTQSVFFKVWGKGERLDPKSGRADDFQWPRPEPKPVVHATAKPAERRARPLLPPRDPNLPPLPVPKPIQ